MLPVRETEGVALRLRVGEAVPLEQRLALRVRVTLSEPERDRRPLTVPEGERGMLLYRPFELAKPLIGLFAGEHGGARFRKVLSQGLQERKLGLRDAVALALDCLAPDVLDARPPE